jgi:hypothetical protein
MDFTDRQESNWRQACRSLHRDERRATEPAKQGSTSAPAAAALPSCDAEDNAEAPLSRHR